MQALALTIIFIRMRTIDTIEIDKIESWLDRVELFSMELKATDRAQLILDLNQQIQAQLIVTHDLKVEDVLKKMGDPMQVANRVRSERGFKPRRRNSNSKPRSFGSLILFGLLAMFVFFATCTFSLPFIIPWGFGHLANKMNGESNGVHSFQFFKNFGGMGSHSDESNKHDPNDLNAEGDDSKESEQDVPVVPVVPSVPTSEAQENINGSFQSDGMNAVHIQGKNLKLSVTSSKSSSIDYACKISSLGYARPFIRKSPSGTVTLAINQVADSASCDIKIPEGVNLEIQTETGDIQLKLMSQNVSLEAAQAEVSFAPADQVSFEIEANTKKGEVKGLAEFQKKQASLKTNKKYQAKFNLEAGNITLTK